VKKTKMHVFAVIRFDSFLADLKPAANAITVKEVVTTQEDAEREVQRLNSLNRGKGCQYVWQKTRFLG
jgi:hypothetical protein